LVQIEPDLSRWVVATDKFGQKQKCWGAKDKKKGKP